jgi:hypothetical protein
MECILDGKVVKYCPGRLIVGFPSYISKERARSIVDDLGGNMESWNKPGVSDVRVPADETLEYFVAYDNSPDIRFVSLDVRESLARK